MVWCDHKTTVWNGWRKPITPIRATFYPFRAPPRPSYHKFTSHRKPHLQRARVFLFGSITGPHPQANPNSVKLAWPRLQPRQQQLALVLVTLVSLPNGVLGQGSAAADLIWDAMVDLILALSAVRLRMQQWRNLTRPHLRELWGINMRTRFFRLSVVYNSLLKNA